MQPLFPAAAGGPAPATREAPSPAGAPAAAMGGEANGAGSKPPPEKESSHTDHRDEFVASEGLSTGGEGGGGAG